MRFTFLSAVAVCLALTPGGRAQDEVRAVIDKAVKAHGGADKLGKQKYLQAKSKGTIELTGGVPFEQEAFVNLEGKFKEVMHLDVAGQKVTVTTVYDGKKAWININGDTMEVSEGDTLEALKEAAHKMRFARLTTLTDKANTLSPLGESSVNGKPAVGVRVSREGHKDVSLYFDKASGLLVRVDSRALDPMSGQEVDEERIITEYQEVDGVKVAKRAVINWDGKKLMETEVVEAQFPESIDDSEFAKP